MPGRIGDNEFALGRGEIVARHTSMVIPYHVRPAIRRSVTIKTPSAARLRVVLLMEVS
jgi:hypothetical protein